MRSTAKLFVVFSSLIVLMMAAPRLSLADRGDHGDRHNDHHHGYHSGVGLSFFFDPFIGYSNYGRYYNQDYVYVSSPVYQAPPPVVVIQSAPTITTIPTVARVETSSTGDYVSINIPNNHGGYTNVALKRLGNGFIGPQGEYYPEFPPVENLRAIYG